MFWLAIIAMIAGTYYFFQWGKKKAAQQRREEEEQEMRERAAQTPAAPVRPRLPPLPFDLSKGRVTAQIATEIGRWSEADANAALGAPTKPRPVQQSGVHQDDYAYVDSAGVSQNVMLSFKNGQLTSFAAYPTGGLRFEEVKQTIGEPIPHPEWAQFEATMKDPNKSHDYGTMAVWEDPTGAVKSFGIKDASAAAFFLSGASWTTRVP